MKGRAITAARTDEASKQQSASQAGAQVQQKSKQQMAAYDKEIGNFKRAYSGCLDARGYSVK